MSFGDKLKSARANAGLSQQELADKLHVSRSAIAKWEAGNGMPDIENLKALAGMFGVTLDKLLDETTPIRSTRTPIDLNQFPVSGKCRDAYDAAVLRHYPDAYRIDVVILEHDFGTVGRCLNVVSFGLAASLWQLTHLAECQTHYYLVDMVDCHIFVCVKPESMLSTTLPNRLLRSQREGEFQHNGRTYFNSGYNLVQT